MAANKKIAIVYDWLDKWGGVERLLLVLHEIFPAADFFTSYHDPQKAKWASGLKVKSSFIQKLPNVFKQNRLMSLPFYAFAFESMDFDDYDLVISVTSSFAKGVITKPKTSHICILLTPTRYFWSHEKEYLSDVQRRLLSPYINYLKKWDRVASWRPDKIISISKTVANRCQKYYGRQSDVVYPPFDEKYWNEVSSKLKSPSFAKASEGKQNYYLVVARLEKYKKVDMVIEAFNNLPDKQLVIVGTGSEEKKLKQKAKKNISFLGQIDDSELARLYTDAQALIMPQEEDFGYVSLEAQFFGCPVVSHKQGGSGETIVDKKTGLLFECRNTNDLIGILEQFDRMSYNLRLETIRSGKKNCQKFCKEKFINNLLNIIKT